MIIRIVTIIFFCFGLFVGCSFASYPTHNLYSEGSFEYGQTNIEVYRFPKFATRAEPFEPVQRVRKAISGNWSLKLPGLKNGGYRIIPRVFMLNTDTIYYFSMAVSSSKPVKVKLEIYQGNKLTDSRKYSEAAGLSKVYKQFTITSGSKETREKPVRLVIWVHSSSDIIVDDIALSDTKNAPDRPFVTLTPNKAGAVYALNESGTMEINASDMKLGGAQYIVRDMVTDKVQSIGSVQAGKVVKLDTSRRGAFWFEVRSDKQGDNNGKLIRKGSYVVINKDPVRSISRSRYGICMEEHGLRSMVDGRLNGWDMYALAKEIGAGNVRLFTPAMPDMVSHDGEHYDFTFLENAIQASHEHGLEPLLELGSNTPHRIPAWLRTEKASENSIDLEEGLRTPKLKKKFTESDGGKYLDLEKYAEYLKKIFMYVDGRVENYEIWNEPGHKFTQDAYYEITRVTRSVQKQVQPGANLLGFSSTKGKGESKARR